MSATITWFGHSTVRLVLPDGRVILIDPWLADNPACPAEHKKTTRCDFVFLTHGHSDHTGEVRVLIEKFNPVVVANYDLCTALNLTLGKGRYEGMNTGGSMTLDGITVTLTKAFHSSSLDLPGGLLYAGMPNGVVTEVPGLASVYHAGDTAVFGDMRLLAQLMQPKICMLPIGDRFTMGARGAALACDLLEPAAILPIHYRTFPILAQSADEFRSALAPRWRDRLIVPAVGEVLTWHEAGMNRR